MGIIENAKKLKKSSKTETKAIPRPCCFKPNWLNKRNKWRNKPPDENRLLQLTIQTNSSKKISLKFVLQDRPKGHLNSRNLFHFKNTSIHKGNLTFFINYAVQKDLKSQKIQSSLFWYNKLN